MTQEEKKLLTKDLCARLPYNVICKLSVKRADVSITEELGLGDTFYKNYVACVHELQNALRLCGIEKEIVV